MDDKRPKSAWNASRSTSFLRLTLQTPRQRSGEISGARSESGSKFELSAARRIEATYASSRRCDHELFCGGRIDILTFVLLDG